MSFVSPLGHIDGAALIVAVFNAAEFISVMCKLVPGLIRPANFNEAESHKETVHGRAAKQSESR